MRHALQFLTVLPVGRLPDRPLGASAWAFPVVGALLGLLAAAVVVYLPFGSLLAIIALAMLTGGLHEDGLADVFDALRANRSKEKMLAILKDSRIGAHGALALIAGFCIRWQALSSITGNPYDRLAAALAISRAMLVLLAAWTPPAGEGLGRHFSDTLPRPSAVLLVLAITVAISAVYWPLLIANSILLLLLRAWFRARLGGVTGDCLGAACQISEVVSFVILTRI